MNVQLNAEQTQHYEMRFILLIFVIILPLIGNGQNIQKFEHFNSRQGLSQNTVFSIHCDSKGFLWIGTWNGLNRYDGHEFKVFQKSYNQSQNQFTNNRIINIWEDKHEMIWMETYDHYYHYFDPRTELIETLPEYSSNPEEENSVGSCFLQYSDSIILMGSTNSGMYLLEYIPKIENYKKTQFQNSGSYALTNNKIRFIYKDQNNDLWVGTDRGINYLTSDDFYNRNFKFQHLYVNVSFSESVGENDKKIWFGTNAHGILSYDKEFKEFEYINPSTSAEVGSGRVNQIEPFNKENFIVSFENNGVFTYNSVNKIWTPIKFHDKTALNIYIDRFQKAWITARTFGVTKLDLNSLKTEYFELTPKETEYITDLERPYFYEDKKDHLWIGLHGSGLAYFDRKNNKFIFYKNNPKDVNSIASNIVHCIGEDKTGQMWLGTGQYKGGLEKIVFSNSAIIHKIPEPEYTSLFTNVVRAIEVDHNGNFWVATKAGKIHLYNKKLNLIHTYKLYSSATKKYSGNNVYTIHQSKDGTIWLGSKGEGLGYSNIEITPDVDYRKISFSWIRHDPKDESSLCNNNVYSIAEDENGNLWIGTFGNGISLLKEPDKENPKFININNSNSNLTSNLIRHLLIDSSNNLWIASTFGINCLLKDSLENFNFHTYLHSLEDQKSVSYNDVIHIYEDSHKRLWFSTFGGGVNILSEFQNPTNCKFDHLTTSEGLSNDVVFGILEDSEGKIWFSSEHGLSSYSPENSNFEVYSENNGLNFNNFSENTCVKADNGNLLFGGNLGFVSINTENLDKNAPQSSLEFTSFMLFNESISPQMKDSPLKQSITYTKEIKLQPNQSSFSIVFSSLDFLDPGNIQYAYYLEDLEENWNYVGNQNKAIYTNLSPGTYIFHVKSTNRNGKWNDHNIKSLTINVLPPWYRTNAAYTGMILLLLILIITVHNIRSKLNNYRRDLLVEKKVNTLKLKFFTNISHEIRTPLTLIIGPIDDLLQLSDLNEKAKNKLLVIRKNAKRMLRLTNQLLDFRKIQNNRMNLKVKEMDIISFTYNIFKSFEPLANHKAIRYKFESEIEHQSIWADPTQLDIVIYNLLSNAIKFTESGKLVKLSIIKNTQLNQIEIAVRDEGKGISVENLNDIFTRYSILSDHELSGTGIGLSLSYELAKLHGGDIRVESVVHKGSTFTLIIPEGFKHLKRLNNIEFKNDDINEAPNVISNLGEIDEQLIQDHSPTEVSAEYIVLVVEDNQEILNYICQSLRPEFNCIKAENGEEAFSLLQNQNPDIIITDIMMPVMDGIEMTKQLKNNFDFSHIPVIMLTAKTDVEDQITGTEAGAEVYIKKPFNTNHLKSVAINLIAQRKKITEKFNSTTDLSPGTININSKDEVFLKKLINYVEENHSQEITIDQLAEYCCLSRTVFYNKVKGLTGFSPIEFLRQLKLKIAAQLLDKGFNVSEVAYQIGFNDVKYFSRQFKALYGYPPSKHTHSEEIKSDEK